MHRSLVAAIVKAALQADVKLKLRNRGKQL
jgi:hypothetical protein